MWKLKIRQVSQYLLFAALTCGLLPAQMTTTGSITGDVMDSSGHAIAGAKITVTSDRTAEVRTATTNEAGMDLALAKRFPVGEKRSFTFRWEAYNAFNHTQYSGINTSPRYDLTTGAQTNTLFGQVTSTRTPRVMQGSLRFTF